MLTISARLAPTARQLQEQGAGRAIDPTGTNCKKRTKRDLINAVGGPWILQRKGFFWFNTGSGSSVNSIAAADLDDAGLLQRDLSTKLPLEDHRGNMLPKDSILRSCSRVIAGVTKSYTERSSRYDGKSNTLRCAALAWRDGSEADFDPAIDQWLRALA